MGETEGKKGRGEVGTKGGKEGSRGDERRKRRREATGDDAMDGPEERGQE